MRIGILGAGVSGLSCALRLKESGVKDITVLEKDAQIGGLTRSKIVNGYVFDCHGGHVFNSKDEKIRKWVFSILPRKYWKYHIRNTKILYKRRLVSYPFELALSELPKAEALTCLVDFMTSKRTLEPDNYYDWLKWAFGNAIASRYMIPYNEKIWAYDLKKMSVDWVKEKMPQPDIWRMITALLTRNPQKCQMPHATFYYPLSGGMQAFIDAAAGELKRKIITDYKVVSIEKINKKFIVNGQDKFDLLISTICLKDLVKSIKHAPLKVKNSSAKLKVNSLTATLCKSKTTEFSWLYIPDKRIPVQRMVFQGNYSPFNCPTKCKGSTISLEIVGKVDSAKQVREFNKHQPIKRLRVGDVIDHVFTKYAYIVYEKNYARNLEVINPYLDRLNILRVGRFAEWKYYNMDACMRSAFKTIDKLVKIYKRKR